MATNQENATAWYYFFNHFNMTEFSKEDFILQLQKYIAEKDGADNKGHAVRSLEDDFNCIINTYLPRYKSNPLKSKCRE